MWSGVRFLSMSLFCFPLKRGDRQGCGSGGMMWVPSGATDGGGGGVGIGVGSSSGMTCGVSLGSVVGVSTLSSCAGIIGASSASTLSSLAGVLCGFFGICFEVLVCPGGTELGAELQVVVQCLFLLLAC